MNIGISTSVVQRGKSGVARYVQQLVRALIPYAADHQFTLFVLKEDLPLFSFADMQMRIVVVGERYRSPVRDILWHQLVLPRMVKKYALDVLHVPSYRRMLYRAPCALVATIHDLAPFHLADKYDWKRMFYGRVVARRLALRQDQIISVSQATACDLQRFFGMPADRMTVIANGIDHKTFNKGDPAAAKLHVLGLTGVNQPFFMYVARLEHPGKNHIRLIEAFNRFKTSTGSPWQLVLAGSDWHGAEVIHNAIRQSPHGEAIRCLGFVAEADLPTWYRAADAFVFPSLFEGFGLPPLEAMACGCPVISSTRGALQEAVGDAALAVDPANVDSLTESLVRTAGDSVLRQQLRKNGLSWAQSFAWEAVATDTMKVYSKAALRFPIAVEPQAQIAAQSH
ncbi:MAG: glycosyltransferase family 4 protein [Opitutales bacterium]|nr:glycosyltransferase family 4 protein [Opitutales bacterium]